MSKVAFDFDWNPQYLRHSFAKSDYFWVSGGSDHVHDCPNNDFTFTSVLFPEEEKVNGRLDGKAIAATNAKAKYFELLLQGSLAMHSLDSWPLSIGRDGIKIFVEPKAFRADSLIRKEFQATEPLAMHAVLATAMPEYAYLLLTLQKGNGWANWFKVIETITTEYPPPHSITHMPVI